MPALVSLADRISGKVKEMIYADIKAADKSTFSSHNYVSSKDAEWCLNDSFVLDVRAKSKCSPADGFYNRYKVTEDVAGKLAIKLKKTRDNELFQFWKLDDDKFVASNSDQNLSE